MEYLFHLAARLAAVNETARQSWISLLEAIPGVEVYNEKEYYQDGNGRIVPNLVIAGAYFFDTESVTNYYVHNNMDTRTYFYFYSDNTAELNMFNLATAKHDLINGTSAEIFQKLTEHVLADRLYIMDQPPQ